MHILMLLVEQVSCFSFLLDVRGVAIFCRAFEQNAGNGGSSIYVSVTHHQHNLSTTWLGLFLSIIK